jgi:hypothetical protein
MTSASLRTWMAAALWPALLGVVPTAHAQGDALVRDTFLAFYPLYEMARLRHLAVEHPANPARTPVNRFLHSRRLLDHTARTVTGPNNDTVYSSARLDLSLGPVLVDTPRIDRRYWSLQFMNAYTDNVAIVGQRTHGEGPQAIAVVGPGWSGPLPAHTTLVRSDTNELWLLARIVVDGPADLANTRVLQDGLVITAPGGPYPVQRLAPPKAPTPAQFLDVVNETLARNPPQGAMRARAQAGAALGIAPGASGAWDTLDAATRARWDAQWPALWASIQTPAGLGTRRIGGWDFPPPGVGQWGENLQLRATVALRGIGALDDAEALYLATYVDGDGARLDGRQRYRVQIPAGGLPVRGFWSLTLYEEMPDGRFFFVDNPTRRYAIGDRTAGLHKQTDGAFEVLVQADPPDDPTNWLPAPRGPFRLTLRAYLPDPELVAGRRPVPGVVRVGP